MAALNAANLGCGSRSYRYAMWSLLGAGSFLGGSVMVAQLASADSGDLSSFGSYMSGNTVLNGSASLDSYEDSSSVIERDPSHSDVSATLDDALILGGSPALSLTSATSLPIGNSTTPGVNSAAPNNEPPSTADNGATASAGSRSSEQIGTPELNPVGDPIPPVEVSRSSNEYPAPDKPTKYLPDEPAGNTFSDSKANSFSSIVSSFKSLWSNPEQSKLYSAPVETTSHHPGYINQVKLDLANIPADSTGSSTDNPNDLIAFSNTGDSLVAGTVVSDSIPSGVSAKFTERRISKDNRLARIMQNPNGGGFYWEQETPGELLTVEDYEIIKGNPETLDKELLRLNEESRVSSSQESKIKKEKLRSIGRYNEDFMRRYFELEDQRSPWDWSKYRKIPNEAQRQILREQKEYLKRASESNNNDL